MNIGQFFEQHRGTHAGRAVDAYEGMESLVFELGVAAAEVLALTSAIEAARALRQMESMNVDARMLATKVNQLAIMAESLQKTTKTHVDRGVK